MSEGPEVIADLVAEARAALVRAIIESITDGLEDGPDLGAPFVPYASPHEGATACARRILRLSHGKNVRDGASWGVRTARPVREILLYEFNVTNPAEISNDTVERVVSWIVRTADSVLANGSNMDGIAVGDCLITGQSREKIKPWIDRAFALDPRRRYRLLDGIGCAKQLVRITNNPAMEPVIAEPIRMPETAATPALQPSAERPPRCADCNTTDATKFTRLQESLRRTGAKYCDRCMADPSGDRQPRPFWNAEEQGDDPS